MKKKILLVDGESDLTFIFKKGLEDAQIIVEALTNPLKCLKFFKFFS